MKCWAWEWVWMMVAIQAIRGRAAIESGLPPGRADSFAAPGLGTHVALAYNGSTTQATGRRPGAAGPGRAAAAPRRTRGRRGTARGRLRRGPAPRRRRARSPG